MIENDVSFFFHKRIVDLSKGYSSYSTCNIVISIGYLSSSFFTIVGSILSRFSALDKIWLYFCFELKCLA